MIMDYLLTLEHWNTIVRNMKDAELEHGISAYTTTNMAKDIVQFIRSARIRQGILFKQRRGEEYETFIEKLNILYDPDAVARAVSNDEFWDTCFSLRSV